ncbi:MAG: hypothetical protein KAS32_15570 [Candidatus Peribacteraceae bacterium]|nr:hypothetical protein [Candidatus Peribacteraceae bacterium]
MKKEINPLDFESHEQLGEKLKSMQMDLHYIKTNLSYSYGEGTLSNEADEAMLIITDLMRSLERIAMADFPKLNGVDKIYRNPAMEVFTTRKVKK